MKDLDLLAKLEMAKTLHNHGVDLIQIATATGLTQPELIAALKIIFRDEIDNHRKRVSRTGSAASLI
ncbi:hypothetical protein NLZ15_14175 [Atlantibacter subterranea]|uniref:hypothetical protein n=1 Tax=Atlantibacter subterraneus TaxID=255519 RepID=UPI0020C504F4|nr:hypothetical protein [Atlantibacter subterranea]UTJ45997.1 hypothetical protein NLZ15_14175 [Atlantibacter subterranea]